MMRYCSGLLVVGFLMNGAYGDTVLVNEDFESYADDTELYQKWVPSVVGAENHRLVDSSLWPDAFGPDEHGAEHIGGAVAKWVNRLDNIAPSPTQKIVVKTDIYDDATSAAKRVTLSMRQDAGINNLWELGVYNCCSAPHYASRWVGFPGTVLPVVTGSAQNWIAFNNLVDDAGVPIEPPVAGNNVPVLGWHTLKAEFEATKATVTLDLNRDGNINATHVVMYDGFSDGGFHQIRFGGPSSLGSAGRSLIFDNIMLTLVDVMLPANTADFNGNGVVDAADYVLWRKNNGLTGTGTQATGDANGDTNVDELDYGLWRTAFGTAVPGSPASLGGSAAVPEPSSIILLVAGLAVAACRRRNR